MQDKRSEAISRLQNRISVKKGDDKNVPVGFVVVWLFMQFVFHFSDFSIHVFQPFSASKTRIEWEQVLENDVFRTNPNTLRFEQSTVRVGSATRYPVESSLKSWAFRAAPSQVHCCCWRSRVSPSGGF